VILDTNALSAFVDGDSGLAEALLGHQRLAIPVVVLGEFRYGIAGSRHRKAYEEWLDRHLQGFEVLPVSAETAYRYAALRVALKRSGRPIPANDAWIAAMALEHDLPILTRDDHFDNLPRVERHRW
jgi:tRNA(fMet)-specific endonuclease VapC